MYDKIYTFLNRFFDKATLFKLMFNISPMYRRSCGRITSVSKDLHIVKIKISLTYKNKNYVGSMFGGSLFSATDPIYMIQLMQILGKDYVVWDKSTEIKFKKPVYKSAYAIFEFTAEELESIKSKVASENEVNHVKKLYITDENNLIYSELDKTIYISSKSYYKKKKSSSFS